MELYKEHLGATLKISVSPTRAGSIIPMSFITDAWLNCF